MKKILPLCYFLLFTFTTIHAQKSAMKYDTSFYNKMHWREIGPFRAGRSIAVAGVRDDPYTYYFGATGGGIWKTEDGGSTWLNVSDGFLKTGSIGALAVAESDPNVIYAGTGEACIRGNAKPGEGMYRSLDRGKSWEKIGLEEGQTIARIAVHPRDENLVYVAVLGHVFGENSERGIFRSHDGGAHWQKILYKNEKSGGVDIQIDPHNPRVLYASLWEAYRNPWSMSSGGAGSGLYKSTDGGDTWTDISHFEGLPKGIQGRISIAISPAKAGRVWASIEAEEGGLFRSDDAGKNWKRVNDDRNIRQRAWYYSHITADPKNPETIYILNVNFYKSIDGGKTISSVRVPHGDNHALWIDPLNPLRMITGNDGGASVSYNGGETWTEEDVATAQFYHVALDNEFPYNVYGDQQDNSSVKIASRTDGGVIDRTAWYDVGGGESGYVTPNPQDPEIVYAGNYDGYLTKYNHRTHQEQNISVWPSSTIGDGVRAAKYRFQWTYPIVVSHFDPKVLYVTAQCVFKTTNDGMSWERLSEDLTRNDSTKMRPSGGPITKDNTGVEYYCTIFAFAESPLDKNVLWAGSDDGLIHVSQDAGTTWKNVTPEGLPEWSMISIIDASHFDAGTAYVAANRYKLDDFAPYIYKTTNFGASWKKITNGIAGNNFAHVVRSDPHRKGLLYAGTERGMYVSFDDGERWQTLQLNLPVTPVHDIAIQEREKDLVVATHGRSFWILDDLSPLYELNDDITKSAVHLFTPHDVYRTGGYSYDKPGLAAGKNPANGAVVYYYFKTKPNDSLRLEFLDAEGTLIKSFAGKKENDEKKGETSDDDDEPKISADSGMNRFVWDMRYLDAIKTKGAILWGGSTRGPVAVPGNYQVRLVYGQKSLTEHFEIKKDPRIQTSPEDFKAQFDLLLAIRDKVSQAHEAVNTIRDIRKQTEEFLKRLDTNPSKETVTKAAKKMNDSLKLVEEEIIQVKIKSGQDVLNFPMKLNNKIAFVGDVVQSADTRPTKQSYDVFADLSAKLDHELERFKKIIDSDLTAFNTMVKDLDVPVVIIKQKKIKL